MIEFGIPGKRNGGKVSSKVEKYPNLAVVTLLERPQAKGSCSIALNAMAVAALGLVVKEDKVCIFYHEGKAHIAKVSAVPMEVPEKEQRPFYANKTFSTKPHFDFLRNHFDVDQDAEVEFEATLNEELGFPTLSILPLSVQEEETSTTVTTQVEEAEDEEEAVNELREEVEETAVNEKVTEETDNEENQF